MKSNSAPFLYIPLSNDRSADYDPENEADDEGDKCNNNYEFRSYMHRGPFPDLILGYI